MIRFLRPLLAVLLTLVAPAVMGATLPAAATSNDEERQILVMLKMPPAHYRPNSSYSGDYGDAAGQAARKRSARRIAERYGVELREGWPMPLLGVDCYVMAVPPGKALDDVIAAVAKEPGVAWAEMVRLRRWTDTGGADLPADGILRMSRTEVARCDNDPNAREQVVCSTAQPHQPACGSGCAEA